MRTGSLVGFVAIALSGALACGGGGGGGSTPTLPSSPATPSSPTPNTPASPTEVTVKNNTFAPATVTVSPGTTVTWTWDTCTAGTPDPYGYNPGATCVDHSIVWDAGGPSSATQSQGTYQRAFATAGTYNYHCAIHGTAMSGKVIVQ